MLNRLWSFLTGYLTLIVEGKSLEKLINMAISRGLYIWDVKWIDQNRAKIKVRLNGIKSLRHIARRSQNSFKITGKGGLPFKIARMKKRKMLLAGAILSLVLVYLMSSFIWFVDVKGNKKVTTRRIINIAANAGLGTGTVKFGLDKDKIEKYIRNEIPEISWVGVRIVGTKAIIEVAEKIIIPPADNSPANVVAKKDGLIKELLVLTGKGMVNEGSMVKKGDILISGIIKPEVTSEEQQGEAQEQAPEGIIKYVRAKGLVRAKVWYEGYGECELVSQGVRRNGKMAQLLSIRMFGREMVLRGSKKPPFRNYEQVTDCKRISIWRNIIVPVELVTTNYYEVSRYRDIISISDAKAKAKEKALADARGKLPRDAKVVSEVTEEISSGSNKVKIKVILEANEDIGEIEAIKP